MDQADPSRRRGCTCKKSGCQKLYCECFASGERCSERCQCLACKNQNQGQHPQESVRTDHNSTNHPQERFCDSAAIPVASESAAAAPDTQSLQISLKNNPVMPTTFPTEHKAAATMAGISPRPVCKMPQQPERTKGCSCKKSNCLKLYCECLAAQRMCDHRCNCEGCKNCAEMLIERERAIAAILERNPMAFQPKVSNRSSQHLRGCNCRKSGCMKNYCECHQAGVPCTSRCACHHCRNTETLVSAKKMLDFAGVSTDGSSRRSSPERQRKPARRTARKSPARKSNIKMQEQLPQTPTRASTRRPSALELLSRSAPTASRSYRRDDAASYEVPPTAPSKRTASHLEQHYNTVQGAAGTRGKHAKRTTTRLPFMDRIEKAATTPRLPNVNVTVENVYTARKQGCSNSNEPELFNLSRSLLHAALAVENATEEKSATEIPGQYQQEGRAKTAAPRNGELSDNRGALSPTSAGLFCEEDYDEAAGDDEANSTLSSMSGAAEHTESASQSGGRRAMRLAAMQERAVLQEFSVWLRNIATGSPVLQ